MTIIPNLQGMNFDEERNEELNAANQFDVSYRDKTAADDGARQDVDQLKEDYESRLFTLQDKVSDLLKTIDDVHEENVELAQELTQIYEEMANEKELLEENIAQ